MNPYEQKVELRRARLEARADRLRKEGNARFNRGKEAMDLIPFGQPMLPGHHSYKRDRNYRNRAQNNMQAGYEQMKAADEVERRAAAVGSGGISSDDPDAADKLTEKVAELEARQAMMIAVNKLVRKYLKDPETGAAKIAEAYPTQLRVSTARILFDGDCMGRKGFPTYELTNNGANIRRIKERIDQLKRNAERETKESAVGDVRMVENAEDNRLQLFFPGKPPAEMREKLKREGFRWSPSEGAWQRMLSAHAVWVAKRILGVTE